MQRALKADRDTAARVILGYFEYRDAAPRSPAGEVTLAGTLRVAGIQQPVVLRSIVTESPEGVISVHSEVPLSLTNFGIVPPSYLYGAARARDAITVKVDLRYPSANRHSGP